MNRRTYLKRSLAIYSGLALPPGVIALSGCTGTGRSEEIFGFKGKTMGTVYSVLLGDMLQDEAAADGLRQEVTQVLDEIEGLMSTYRDTSELTRFNTSSSRDWYSLSTHTSRVVASALQASSLSDGAFDVTVGPLVNLWGFGPGGSVTTVPAERAIRQSLERVGYETIERRAADGAIRKTRPGADLDLSGIAKGYAVDRVAEQLDRRGYSNYLVELGGELRARGKKPDGSHWRVAIERPAPERRAVYRVIDLKDRAIATSGDYRNFFDSDGRRYSHSIDPRTGRPVTHGLASVSVVAESTIAADAWSTALMILGLEAGMAFARGNGIAAHFIQKAGKGFVEHVTDSFESYLAA